MRGNVPPLPNTPSWRGKVKGKAVPVFFLIEHALKVYWGVEV
jgi:hypothetical protein